MHTFRWARRAAGATVVATGGAAYFDEDIRKSVAIAAVGSVARLFIRGGNQLHLHESQHLERALQRPKGTALLSVSNHIATVDDPHLLASIVPFNTLMHGRSEMRWGVCGDDVCFRPGTMLCRFADAAKVLPIRRGAGIWQPELDAIIEKLRGGGSARDCQSPSRGLVLLSQPCARQARYLLWDLVPCHVHAAICECETLCVLARAACRSIAEWVHYFPEGKIRQDGRVHPFRRGVGRLAAESVNSDLGRLCVLPFYHTGTDALQPTTPTSKSIFSWPNMGSDIHVMFGEPVDLSELLALRSEPPFDRRPELLYEVIAHTLEERVRSLRSELHAKLGISPHIPPEGGCFDNGDAAVLHPDAQIRKRMSRSRQAAAAAAREQQQQHG